MEVERENEWTNKMAQTGSASTAYNHTARGTVEKHMIASASRQGSG